MASPHPLVPVAGDFESQALGVRKVGTTTDPSPPGPARGPDSLGQALRPDHLGPNPSSLLSGSVALSIWLLGILFPHLSRGARIRTLHGRENWRRCWLPSHEPHRENSVIQSLSAAVLVVLVMCPQDQSRGAPVLTPSLFTVWLWASPFLGLSFPVCKMQEADQAASKHASDPRIQADSWSPCLVLSTSSFQRPTGRSQARDSCSPGELHPGVGRRIHHGHGRSRTFLLSMPQMQSPGRSVPVSQGRVCNKQPQRRRYHLPLDKFTVKAVNSPNSVFCCVMQPIVCAGIHHPWWALGLAHPTLTVALGRHRELVWTPCWNSSYYFTSTNEVPVSDPGVSELEVGSTFLWMEVIWLPLYLGFCFSLNITAL